jgi:hypothetical protein
LAEQYADIDLKIEGMIKLNNRSPLNEIGIIQDFFRDVGIVIGAFALALHDFRKIPPWGRLHFIQEMNSRRRTIQINDGIRQGQGRKGKHDRKILLPAMTGTITFPNVSVSAFKRKRFIFRLAAQRPASFSVERGTISMARMISSYWEFTII